MKLRNSFISLKNLSNELNIPLATPSIANTLSSEMKNIKIIPADYDIHQVQEPNIDDKVQCTDVASTNTFKKNATSRVKNLKKSMLNDNKLIKLRNKFLKRSKSSSGILDVKPMDNVDDDGMSRENAGSIEENQNKENECPKQSYVNSKFTSPNRNRVKMGTRVFSAQFLNKSFDNIYDNNALDVYRFEDTATEYDFRSGRRNSHRKLYSDFDSDDNLSLKSTSLSSMYSSEKMSDFQNHHSEEDAYVIRKWFFFIVPVKSS